MEIKKFLKENLKTYLGVLPYSLISVVLALVLLLMLTYFSFYMHEYGHASAVIISTLIKHKPTITINFTYVPYKIPLVNVSYLVPQQTTSKMPQIMSVYGVLFSIMYYTLIFISAVFIISKIKKLKDNKRIPIVLVSIFFLLIVQDIILNLFCGTDGFNIPCGEKLIWLISGIFDVMLWLGLGWLVIEVMFLIKINRGFKQKTIRKK